MTEPTPVHARHVLTATLMAGIVILLGSLAHNPGRRLGNAIGLAVAGGTYIDGGFGAWEFGFAIVVAYCAYRALQTSSFGGYRALGVGWTLHAAWDVAHHLTGKPMVGWIPTSSAECVVTDLLIAVWFFAGARSVFGR